MVEKHNYWEFCLMFEVQTTFFALFGLLREGKVSLNRSLSVSSVSLDAGNPYNQQMAICNKRTSRVSSFPLQLSFGSWKIFRTICWELVIQSLTQSAILRKPSENVLPAFYFSLSGSLMQSQQQQCLSFPHDYLETALRVDTVVYIPSSCASKNEKWVKKLQGE